MPKLVIGVTGEKRGGKGTAVQMIKNIIEARYSVEVFSSGQLLMQDLRMWGIPLSRENLMLRANQLVELYGKDTISKGMIKRIVASTAQIAIYDAVRWDADLHQLQSSRNYRLLYVTAGFHKRLERARRAAEKGEAEISEAQFLLDECAPTEREIPHIAQYAHWKYENNGTREDFLRDMQNFVKYKVEPVMNHTTTCCSS